MVDLAVSRFELTQGIANLNARTQPLNIQANNFHAQLFYNTLKRGYQGALYLEPVYVVSGRNTPVTLKVSLPVTLQKDRIDFQHASITTPVSTLSIDGSVQNMNDPRVNTHVNGHIAMIDVASVVDIPIAVNVRGVPSQIDIDANAAISNHAIDVTELKLSVGQSSIVFLVTQEPGRQWIASIQDTARARRVRTSCKDVPKPERYGGCRRRCKAGCRKQL